MEFVFQSIHIRNFFRSFMISFTGLLGVWGSVIIATATVANNKTENFVCDTFSHRPATDTLKIINCTFQFDYGGILATECWRAYDERVNYETTIAIYVGRTAFFTSILRSPTLTCVADVPIDVQIQPGEQLDSSHFTDIRRKRCLDNATNSYILEITLLKFNYYLQSTQGAVKYQIFTSHLTSVIKTNVFFMFGYELDERSDKTTLVNGCNGVQRDFCGDSLCRRVIRLKTLLLKEFVDIPVFSFKESHYLYRKIGDVQSESQTEKVFMVPKYCLPLRGPSLKLGTYNKAIVYNGSEYKNRIPFVVLADALRIKSERLLMLDIDKMSAKDIEEKVQLFRNFTDRFFIVQQNHYVAYENVNDYLNLQKNLGSTAVCAPDKPIHFIMLQKILHLFDIYEIIVGGNGDIEFNRYLGLRIRSKFLLDYGPGNYSYGRQECLDYSYFTIDFITRPSRVMYRRPSKLDLFKEETKQDEVTVSCSSICLNKTIFIRFSKKLPENVTINTTMFRSTIEKSRHHDFRSFNIVRQPQALVTAESNMDVYCNILYTPNMQKSTIMYSSDGPIQIDYFPKDDVIVCKNYGTVSMRHWRCKNRFQCQMVASSCYQDVRGGEFAARQLNSEFDDCKTNEYKPDCMPSLYDYSLGTCLVKDYWKDEKKNCKAIVPSEMGVVQCEKYGCGVGNDYYDLQSIYFRGFDNVLYIDYKMKSKPPKEAILKLTSSSKSNTFYTHEEYSFTCEAHNLFFDQGIRWFLKYANKTVVQPPQELISDVLPSSQFGFDIKSVLRVSFLDTLLIEITCSAPNFNNENWTEISIETPFIESVAPKITTLETEVRFLKDAKDQSLTCQASGLPPPKILWSRPNSEIKHPIRILEEHTLYFPSYNSSFAGDYICTASNLAGNNTKRFFVQGEIQIQNPLILKRYREMKEIIDLLNGSTTVSNETNADIDPMNFLFDTNYDLAKHSFIVDERFLLGKGHYGEVYRGLLQGVNKAVAFKTTCSTGGMQPLKALVSETKILMYIGAHEHLVTLLGVYRKEINSAIEFCELGSLESFLRKNKQIFQNISPSKSKMEYTNMERLESEDEKNASLCTTARLLKWSEQISDAMDYLGTKNVVHMDLATRNILLTEVGNVKVTDFGLSRRTYNYSEYIKTANDPLPWRWLAPESLKTNTFSVKSDVWTYGITLWEIFSLGDIPYPGMSPIEIVQELENGLRNYKPRMASDEIYNIMLRCWNINPGERPSFLSIKSVFSYAASTGLEDLKNEICQAARLEDLAVILSSSEYLEC